MNESSASLPIGFLTVISVDGLGYCGGYLLINRLGRPVEFHCTAPVAENRTQRILYGRTYPSYLYCDQIGRALVAKARQEVVAVVTDLAELTEMRESLEPPLLWLRGDEVKEEESTGGQNAKRPVDRDLLEVGPHRLEFLSGAAMQRSPAAEACRRLCEASIPLEEPFERIRQAIDEAQAAIR